jgi:hypothetical protein
VVERPEGELALLKAVAVWLEHTLAQALLLPLPPMLAQAVEDAQGQEALLALAEVGGGALVPVRVGGNAPQPVAHGVGARVAVPEKLVEGVLEGEAPCESVEVKVSVALGMREAVGLQVALGL